MRQRFLHTFLLILFFQTTYAQSFQTKLFFCNLPIEHSKTEVISAIKSDSSKFVLDNTKKINDRFYSFDAEIKNFQSSIPSPSENPSISIYEVKFIIDDTIKLKTPTIDLTLRYDNHFARIKAKKAYNIITKKIKSDYTTLRMYPAQKKIDDPARSEQTASYFSVTDIGTTTYPKCVVSLIGNTALKIWTVTITYSMERL